MTLASVRKLFSGASPPPTVAEHDYARLITDNLDYIERQCRKAVSGSGAPAWDGTARLSEAELDNEADQLLTELLDHLRADDFRVLRAFKGGSRITTYLTAVIANLVVDLVRKKKGRSRARERACELGPTGEQLYDLVFRRGYSLQDAHGHLQSAGGCSPDLDGLRVMLERIRGRDGGSQVADWPYMGQELLVDGELEVVVPDPSPNAEQQLDDGQRTGLARGLLDGLLEGLSGEERLMLRMRFPQTEDGEPHSNRQIAELLGQTEKAVDNRIRRILMRCRESLISRGLSLDDLITAGK